MAIQTKGSSQTPGTMAEINVTPLVDVMLVLLIVFMISAPLMTQGLQVDLPKAQAGSLNETPEQLVLTITKDQTLRINDKPIPKGTLSTRLNAIREAKPTIEVVIQGDQSVPYGFVAQVMAEVKKAQILRVGLVTQPGESQSKL